MSQYHKHLWICAALLVGLLVCCCAASGALVLVQEKLYPPAVVAVEAEDEYHRGAYDMCTYLYTLGTGASDEDAMRDCGKLVERVAESDWYEQESKGYTAP